MRHEKETVGDKRFSFSRFKRVMQRPPLNNQEGAMLTTGIAAGALFAEGAIFMKLLDAVSEGRDVQRPLVEGVVLGLGLVAPAITVSTVLPVALNRGWGQKEAPVMENPHSPETSTKAIASYIKTNWRNITAQLGIYGPPLISAPTGLLFAVAGHDVPANVLMWGTLADVSIVLPLAPIFTHRKKN